MKNYSSAHKQDFVVQWYNSMIIHWLIANLEEFMQDLRVFVIDNSIIFQNSLVQELTKKLPSGSLVEHAAQPADALDKLSMFNPTTIVLNFALGSLLVKQEKFLPLLVKTFPKVPIITYGILESGEKAAKILGASHYLKKPSIGQPADAFYDNLVSTLLAAQSKPSPTFTHSTSIGSSAAARQCRPYRPHCYGGLHWRYRGPIGHHHPFRAAPAGNCHRPAHPAHVLPALF